MGGRMSPSLNSLPRKEIKFTVCTSMQPPVDKAHDPIAGAGRMIGLAIEMQRATYDCGMLCSFHAGKSEVCTNLRTATNACCAVERNALLPACDVNFSLLTCHNWCKRSVHVCARVAAAVDLSRRCPCLMVTIGAKGQCTFVHVWLLTQNNSHAI
eukprot:1156195-Pelagomonas_calceolata.AAC.4